MNQITVETVHKINSMLERFVLLLEMRKTQVVLVTNKFNKQDQILPTKSN